MEQIFVQHKCENVQTQNCGTKGTEQPCVHHESQQSFTHIPPPFLPLDSMSPTSGRGLRSCSTELRQGSLTHRALNAFVGYKPARALHWLTPGSWPHFPSSQRALSSWFVRAEGVTRRTAALLTSSPPSPNSPSFPERPGQMPGKMSIFRCCFIFPGLSLNLFLCPLFPFDVKLEMQSDLDLSMF